ncbi:DUF418 domain-containing protein [Acaricomes phytoseiuli]|uniref:DUF418 domain-containing protein n=1 Tax=Acaricomes phytoseiuli TaxID=291968 RepID=UPI0003677070|nr:DUF418 domain-containing protein [Acaricomes phytoseiuli]MCW1249138.1 DUF418 domain-containing protein [Acaricomes phytoseiuli]
MQGKFFSTFGLVFGLSFAYYLTSAKLAGRPVIWGTLRRLAALGIFGTIHALFYSADVLRAHAMLGVILLALSFLPQWASRVAGALGIVLAAPVSPAMGLALVGYWFASSGRFARWSTDVAVLVKLAVPALFVFVGAEIWGQLQPDEVMTSKMFSSVAGPILYSTVILILWNYFPRVLQMLYQPLGKLTLTHYLGATFLITATAAVFGFPQGEGSWIMAILLGVGIVVFQWIFSLIWLRFFTQGPLEWIWRSVTWLSMPPILRSSTRESR